MVKPSIIFTTPVLEYPPIGGPRLRIANSIKALSQVADLIIYSRTSLTRVGGEKAVEYFKQYSREFHFSPSVSGQASRWGLLSLWNDFADIKALAKKNQVEIIWLGYGNISYGLAVILKLFSPYKVVIDTDSVWSRFVLRAIPYQKTFSGKFKSLYRGWKKRLQEFLGAKLADITTAVSEFDAAYYRKFSRKVAVFSNVIDLKDYNHPHKLENVRMLYPAIYFSGSFGPGSAMEYAAIWLLKEVMPLVWHANPAVNIYLVGRGNTDNLKKISDPRVMITGEVPDTLPYVKTADAAVVPLWFESGTRFKILEAAACRTPVVSTTLGAEGLSVAHEKNILISDKPQGFADAILKIIADKKLAQQLSENAYHDIAEKFDISRAVKEAQQILMKLA